MSTDRLIEVLQLLAAPADVQIRSLPDYVVIADEIALLFDDELTNLQSTGHFNDLSPELQVMLKKIDAQLDGMGAAKEAWTVDSLRTSRAWEQIREQARFFLAVVGTDLRTPKIDWVTFVPG